MRCDPFSFPTHAIGSMSFMPTDCGSTRSRRCCTATIRAPKASGSRMCTVAVKILKPSRYCKRVPTKSVSTRPVPSFLRKSRHRFRGLPRRQRMVDWVSRTNGILAGCTTRCNTSGANQSIDGGITTTSPFERSTRTVSGFCSRFRTTKLYTAKVHCSTRCPAMIGSGSPTSACCTDYNTPHPAKSSSLWAENLANYASGTMTQASIGISSQTRRTEAWLVGLRTSMIFIARSQRCIATTPPTRSNGSIVLMPNTVSSRGSVEGLPTNFATSTTSTTSCSFWRT